MNEMVPHQPEIPDTLEKIFVDFMKTVQMEETALSNILGLENEVIQKAKNDSANLEEFVSINESINHIMTNITKVQIMTQIKLQQIAELIQKLEEVDGNETLEE